MQPRRRPRGRDDRGASAVEYALLIAGIAAVIVVIVFLLGGQVADLFRETCDAVDGRGATGGSCP